MNECQRDAVKNYLHNAWTLYTALHTSLSVDRVNHAYLHAVEADLNAAANEWARTNKAGANA